MHTTWLHFIYTKIMGGRVNVAGRGVGLLIPSFTKGKNQLSSNDGEISPQIASVCIHLEKQT